MALAHKRRGWRQFGAAWPLSCALCAFVPTPVMRVGGGPSPAGSVPMASVFAVGAGEEGSANSQWVGLGFWGFWLGQCALGVAYHVGKWKMRGRKNDKEMIRFASKNEWFVRTQKLGKKF